MDFKLYGKDNVTLNYNVEQRDGVFFVHISMHTADKTVPSPFTLEWLRPAVEQYTFWGPQIASVRGLAPDWKPSATNSSIAAGLPIHSVISSNNANSSTVAVSDPKTPISITTGIDEKKASMKYKVTFFTSPTTKIDSYEATVRIDERKINYCDAIRSASEWIEKDCNYPAAPVPEAARMPMDSLWYSFHQDLDFDRILEQCRHSKEFGLETVIIDDGWQTTDNGGGYAYCGDWEPIGLPRIAELVSELHKLGLKVMLWFSVPFLGKLSKNYEDFKDYTLYADEYICVLDPRYKKVRDYLKGFYVKALKEWDLDGLKLDFIDSFHLGSDDDKPTHLRDFESLEDGIEALMSEVREELISIKPDALIEFRQGYIGPAIRKYGNILRVCDCPCDALANRRAIIDLRLTSGKTAIHSDMLMWHKDDTAESVALQIASVLFAVPQISVLLGEIPEDHKRTLKFYMSFWREHRELLLDGRLYAEAPGAIYSKAYSKKDGEAVYVCYEDPTVSGSFEKLVAVNCTGGKYLYLDGFSHKSYKVVNCKGDKVSEGTLSPLQKIEVERGGMIFVW